MISRAYIFGSLGKAAFHEAGEWFVLDARAPGQVRKWHPLDRNLLSLSHTPETLFLDGEQRLEDVKKALAQETQKHEALTLALQLMDSRIDNTGLKASIATLLEKYLAQQRVQAFVENRLLTTIVPDPLNPTDALAVCRSLKVEKAASLYQTLESAAESIQQFYTVWQRTGKEHFTNLEAFDTAYALLAADGFAKTLVLAVRDHDRRSWDNAAVEATYLLQQHGLVQNATLFTHMREALRDIFAIRFEEQAPKQQDAEPADEIMQMIEAYMEGFHHQREVKRSRKDLEKLWRRKKENRNRVKGKLSYTDVNRLQTEIDGYSRKIVQAVLLRHTAGVEESLKHLLSLQFAQSDPQHICKSLCNVASSVLTSGAIALSKRLLKYATIFNSEDPFVHNQYAEILKSEGDLVGAKTEYLRIKGRFPDDVVAQTGYAEILKSEGDLAGAKAEYLQIKGRFPDNVVAQNGYAEILKSEGDLVGAKTEYLRIKGRFPDDVVAQTGYAEILKSEGDLAGAKAEYLQIKGRFPDNVVAQNGYAEILKSEGNLAGAKAEYLQIKGRFPDDVVAQKGYAEILKSEGDLAGAKAEYLQIKGRFPDDVVAQTGYAEILKSEGDLAGAKAEYLQIKGRFPDNVVAQNGYAEILKSEGDLAGAKAEYEQIVARHPSDQVARHALCCLLILLNEKIDFEIPLPANPKSEQDFYWHHFHISRLIKSGEWDAAEKMLRQGLKTCQFYQTRVIYKRTLRYVALLKRDFATALAEINEAEETEPFDFVLRTHLFAVTGQQDRAKKELEKTRQFRQYKMIDQVAHLLAERFELGAVQGKRRPPEELDPQILELEFEALLLAA